MSLVVLAFLFQNKKITFLMKLDQNYNCVFKIMLSTKLTIGEYM